MVKAPIPANEAQRHLDLLSYHILDSEEEQDYNDLIELAAHVCDCPVALVSFVDTNRQWFKAKLNLQEKEKSRETSFCGHVIMTDEVMVVKDAAKDKRFADNPDVAGGLNIQFYAGAPIISEAGNKLGTVCVIDNTPKKEFGEKEQKALKIISAQVSKLLELRMKNKIVKQQSEAISKNEKKIARLATMNREKENEYVAYELYENIAQVLAVAKLKVEVVTMKPESSKESLQQAKDYISLALNDIKKLSRSITPTTLKSSDYSFHIQSIIDDYNREEKVKINFTNNGSSLQLNGTLGLTIYRIIENMLLYAKLTGSPKATIKLDTKSNTLLSFEYIGDNDMSTSDEANMVSNNIAVRADIIKAIFTHYPSKKLMQVVLPDA